MTTSIARHPLPTSHRAIHADNLFGLNFPFELEPHVFDTASALSTDYRGGYWEFYDLSNGGFYMAPESETPFRVLSPNGYEGVLSADAFGITVCLYAYSNLSFKTIKSISTIYARQYHWLREYSMDHAEVAEILRATD